MILTFHIYPQRTTGDYWWSYEVITAFNGKEGLEAGGNTIQISLSQILICR